MHFDGHIRFDLPPQGESATGGGGPADNSLATSCMYHLLGQGRVPGSCARAGRKQQQGQGSLLPAASNHLASPGEYSQG